LSFSLVPKRSSRPRGRPTLCAVVNSASSLKFMWPLPSSSSVCQSSSVMSGTPSPRCWMVVQTFSTSARLALPEPCGSHHSKSFRMLTNSGSLPASLHDLK